MKKFGATLFTVLLSATVVAEQLPSASFSYFKYEGKDKRFNRQIDQMHQYMNPVISGFYPDPSVCRVGDTYYLVNSTFSYFPGVPIFKSNDLVNWQQIGNVLDRESQLPLQGQLMSKGIFAPQISFNPKNKTYYMTTMNKGIPSVFYVKTKHPEKGWSEPIQMKRGGMDTSFFFDTDGKAYVVYSHIPFGGPKYDGQLAIHMNEFDWQADTIKQKTYELTTGSKCIENSKFIEGPHLYKVGKYYYLMCAEHGTLFNHSEVIFRSESIYGPWEECPFNPILTQRDLTDHHRLDMVTSAGHADLVQAKDGQWWAVFLGCRPYEVDEKQIPVADFYNTGRETFLLPVRWKDGWPIILEQGKAIPTIVEKTGMKNSQNMQVTGNYTFTDVFDNEKLDYQWLFLRNPEMSFYDWSGAGIKLKAKPVSIYQLDSPAAIFYRQKHTSFYAETELMFTVTDEQQLAGLVVFQNEKFNFVMGKTMSGGETAITVMRTECGQTIQLGSAEIPDNKPVRLKVEGDGRYYTFSYAVGNGQWQTLVRNADGINLSSVKAGGYLGATIGLYATSNKDKHE